MSKTKQEKYELKIQQGKKLLAEIQTEREKIGSLFFAGLIKSGDIEINNIDGFLDRGLAKDKHRKIYRDYFDQIIKDIDRSNQKNLKAGETTTTTEKPTDELVDEPTTTTITEETAEDPISDYDSLFRSIKEPDHVHN